MITRTSLAALAALVALPIVGTAQEPHLHLQGDTTFDHFLISSEMVMQHQRQIGLTAEQRGRITSVIKELQAEVLDLQWAMEEAQQALVEMLNTPSVDAVAALAQIDKVLDIEGQVKKAHFAHLIHVKNTLSPEQQEQLHQLARHSPSHDPGQRHR